MLRESLSQISDALVAASSENTPPEAAAELDNAYSIVQQLLGKLDKADGANLPVALKVAAKIVQNDPNTMVTPAAQKAIALALEVAAVNLAVAAANPAVVIQAALIDAHKAGKALQVYVAIITDPHGETALVNLSIAGLDKAIADYCRDNWDAFNDAAGNEAPPSAVDLDVVNEFFATVGEFELYRETTEVLP